MTTAEAFKYRGWWLRVYRVGRGYQADARPLQEGSKTVDAERWPYTAILTGRGAKQEAARQIRAAIDRIEAGEGREPL